MDFDFILLEQMCYKVQWYLRNKIRMNIIGVTAWYSSSDSLIVLGCYFLTVKMEFWMKKKSIVLSQNKDLALSWGDVLSELNEGILHSWLIWGVSPPAFTLNGLG